ncbi:MAG: DUF362 domain-containing protein [Candidatus Thorarchaeota archaeon]
MTTKVFAASGPDRKSIIPKLLDQLDLSNISGKHLVVKANFNSADPFPAATHIDTLRLLVERIQSVGSSKITLVARSGMGNTKGVLEQMGVLALSEEFGFSVVILDELKADDYVLITPEGSHWDRGFLLAKVFQEADVIIQTCCLKTHQYGGHFTLSLKNSVGMVAKFNPDDGYNYMKELHSSKFQRIMIAEINTVYKPLFVLMDGVKAFVRGGPASGEEVEPNIILLSTDRVAIDAVGVAILRHFGTTPEVEKGGIFEQEQIARSCELKIGICSSDEIELIPLDDESQSTIDLVMEQM